MKYSLSFSFSWSGSTSFFRDPHLIPFMCFKKLKELQKSCPLQGHRSRRRQDRSNERAERARPEQDLLFGGETIQRRHK